jgi:hypothetical protein
MGLVGSEMCIRDSLPSPPLPSPPLLSSPLLSSLLVDHDVALSYFSSTTPACCHDDHRPHL